MAQLPIATKRLSLRCLDYNDIQDILDILAHPSIARILNMKMDESSVREYIDKQNSYQPFQEGKYYDLVVEYKEEGKVIGLIGIQCKPHHQGAIGWAIGINYQGSGFALEGASALISYAFSKLGLHRIYAVTSNINTPSWKLMERLGMRKEAHFRETEWREGKWIDQFIYAILSTEWQDHGQSSNIINRIK